MGARDRLFRTVGRQLGHPSGPLGRLVVRSLDKGNAPMVGAAVDALPAGAATVADVGFGGGASLRLLLDRPGVTTVHAVELAGDMVARARRAFRAEADAGRLVVASGSLTAIPLSDAALDGLITVNTIYFVQDLPAALAEVARVVRPGGTAVVGIRDPDAMRELPVTAEGFTLRPVEDVVGAMAAAGLHVHARPTVVGRLPAELLVATRA